jgi:phage gpG-like protein
VAKSKVTITEGADIPRKFRLLRKRANKINKPAEELGRIFALRTRAAIARGQSATGQQLARLDERTLRNRELLGFSGNTPLMRSGRLQRSLKENIRRRSRGVTIEIGSDSAREAAKLAFHHSGSADVPARPVLDFDGSDERETKKHFNRFLKEEIRRTTR